MKRYFQWGREEGEKQNDGEGRLGKDGGEEERMVLVRGAAGETRQHPDGAGLGEVGSRESAREGPPALGLGAAQLGHFSLNLRRVTLQSGESGRESVCAGIRAGLQAVTRPTGPVRVRYHHPSPQPRHGLLPANIFCTWDIQ